MIPILYAETETQFNTNGIGRLSDAISCKVTEERNGVYDLEMVYPITGQHYSEIQKYSLIYATPADGKAPQPFEVYRISSPINGRVAIFAHHISYRLNKTVTTGGNVEASPQACTQALQSLIDNAILPTGQSFGFTFETDVVTGASFKESEPKSVKSRLLGSEGSILDQFGGEFEWDKFNVILHAERGSDNGVTIRYGKNLTDLTQEYNIDNTVTGCIPYWKGEEETITGSINYSKYASQYVRQKIVAVDFTDQFEEAPSLTALNNLGKIYADEHGLPTVSIKVSFVDLAQTEEYKDLIPLTRVNLCDTVTVQYEDLGINQTAKISKTIYDVLADKYESVTVGDITPSLSQTITAGLAQDIETLSTTFVNKLSKTKSDITQAYTEAIINATAWITGSDGFVMAVTDESGTWKELIFSSSRDMEAQSTKILRINNNGIGFSQTGLAGPYTNAWTIDGNLIADFIHGGTLTLGGNGNANGILRIVNSSGQQIGKWDKDGITVDSGSIDANNVNITNINGGNIKTGTITATQIASNTITANEIQSNSVSTDRLQTSEIGDLGSGVYFSSNIGVGGRIGTDGLRCSGEARFTGDTIDISVSTISVNTGTPGWKDGDSRYVENVGSFVHGLLVSSSNIWS